MDDAFVRVNLSSIQCSEILGLLGLCINFLFYVSGRLFIGDVTFGAPPVFSSILQV